MKQGLRLAICAAIIGFGLTGTIPALARTKCHCTTAHSTRHKKHHAVMSGTGQRADPQLRDAQAHLVNLGYYDDTPDGINGPKTQAAIKNFQREHYLRVTGILTPETLKAIIAADNAAATINAMPKTAESPPSDFYATHPDPYGYVHPQYSDPLMTSPQIVGANSDASRSQTLPTRYGTVGLIENGGGGNDKHYTVTLDGQPIMVAENQPSVIGVSRTYNLGDDDVIILSAYRDADPVCAYNTYLFVINSGGHAVKNVGSCSRGYQAEARHDALYITFPQTDSGSAVGATYRYEKGRLFKL